MNHTAVAGGRARGKRILAATLLGSTCSPALALDYDWNGIEFQLRNLVSVGARWRMQDRSTDLIGKLNVEGQQTLCASDDCLSLSGDPAPARRVVNARGAYFGANGDDGNLNYDQHDVVAALAKLNSDFTVHDGDWLGRLHAAAFYDPVNAHFDQTHANTLYQPRHTRRDDDTVRAYARGADLYEAFLQYSFEWGEGRAAALTVGNQAVRWGESTLLAVNSLNEINPPSLRRLHAPGSEINEVFQPVPAVTLSTSLSDTVSAELFYQLQWKAAELDPKGSFFSFADFIGGKNLTANLSLGQFPEDPDSRFKPGNRHLRQLSQLKLTVPVQEKQARDDGQYGLRLNYFADWLNAGTDLSLYFLHYHSRLPYASMDAAQDSCGRDSSSVIDIYVDCRGFNGELPNPIYGHGLEVLPVNTAKAYIEYPEDLQMYGISFNTNLGSWSLAGEYAWRPHMPVLVSLQDLFLSAALPALPANRISFTDLASINDLDEIAALVGQEAQCGVECLARTPGAIPGLVTGLATLADLQIPAAGDAFPAYLTRYRGIGRVRAGQNIRGYEYLGVGEFGLTAIRAISNALGADQILFINEVGFTHIVGMPNRSRLQFETFYLNSTHASEGADGSGTADGRPPATLRFNPHQQTHGFADDFAWGIRSLVRGEYNDAFFGLSVYPLLLLAWDINGTAPQPLQNFIEGRKEITFGGDLKITQALTARAAYQWFTGAGDRNSLHDRDNLALSLSYAF